MERLVLARHAETELNVTGVVNGDPGVETLLTARGQRQATELGHRAGVVDLVTHTGFARTRATAELAWPDAPLLEVPELDEISFGRFEGRAFGDGYSTWAWSADPLAQCPGGGESRAAALTRYCDGYRRLLARPERVVAHVGHGAPIRYLLDASRGLAPRQRLEAVGHGAPFTVEAADVTHAVELLEAWVRDPAWA